VQLPAKGKRLLSSVGKFLKKQVSLPLYILMDPTTMQARTLLPPSPIHIDRTYCEEEALKFPKMWDFAYLPCRLKSVQKIPKTFESRKYSHQLTAEWKRTVRTENKDIRLKTREH